MDEAVHPTRPRTFTHAEAARLTGFPDDYVLDGMYPSKGRALYGKGITVQAGEWVFQGVLAHLEGRTCAVAPRQMNEREWMIDVSEAWRVNKPVYAQPTLFE